MAWDQLKKEYAQTKVAVNAHIDETINLFPVKGSNYLRVQEFYEKLRGTIALFRPRRKVKNYKGS